MVYIIVLKRDLLRTIKLLLISSRPACNEQAATIPGSGGGVYKLNIIGCRQRTPAIIILFLISSLIGCEAPLQMEGVEQRRSEPVRYSDKLQAATSHGDTIIVVGNQGLILTSNDEGRSWSRNKLPDWPALIDVAACPNGLFAALAVEGQVWISADKGGDWFPHPFKTEEAPQAITCDPQNRLWIVGSFSSILSSSDSGETWKFNSLDEDIILTNIQFLDMQNAVISGEFGTVLKSDDGGDSWQRMPDIKEEFYPHAMYFNDPNSGWLVSLRGQILYTTDGAESWVLQESQTIAPLYGIEKVANDIYIVGGEGIVLKLQGNQWLRINHGKPIRLYLRAVVSIGNDKLLIAGNEGALYVLSASELQN